MRTITWLLIVGLCVGAGWWFYMHSTPKSVANSSEVFTQDGAALSPDTDIDGKPYQQVPPPATKQSATVAALPAAPTPPAPTSSPAATTTMAPIADKRAPSIAPASDTLEKSAPTGMAFGGSGKYQWYRQGNLTWRIDTRNGSTCVDFATMDEWTKPIVYSNGCRFRS